MVPAILPGDWLVVSPLPTRWPASRLGRRVPRAARRDAGDQARRGARPASACPFAGGFLVLDDDEAWLLSDADEKAAAAVGSGPPIDSQRYGPVEVEALVGRVLFRYWPLRRIGRIAHGPRRSEIPA